jgi:hypothetical protein
VQLVSQSNLLKAPHHATVNFQELLQSRIGYVNGLAVVNHGRCHQTKTRLVVLVVVPTERRTGRSRSLLYGYAFLSRVTVMAFWWSTLLLPAMPVMGIARAALGPSRRQANGERLLPKLSYTRTARLPSIGHRTGCNQKFASTESLRQLNPTRAGPAFRVSAPGSINV